MESWLLMDTFKNFNKKKHISDLFIIPSLFSVDKFLKHGIYKHINFFASPEALLSNFDSFLEFLKIYYK